MKKKELEHIRILRTMRSRINLSGKYARPLVWGNTNEAIVEVDEEGNIVAKHKGYATLCVKDVNGDMSRWRVEVTYLDKQEEVAAHYYLLVYERWLENLVGSRIKSEYKSLIATKIIEQAQSCWSSFKIKNKTLWEDELTKDYPTNPLHLHTHYKRLEVMAKGYQLSGSDCYQNKELLSDILMGIEWLYQNGYHERQQYGNWWEWEIGIPKTLINLCVLLREELGEVLIKRYTDPIYYHQPDPFHMGSSEGSRYRHMEHQGANRVDTAVVAMGLGMLRQDYEQLVMARDAVESILKLQNKEGKEYIDGFYSDGSFIQHSHVPYTGTYGGVLLEGAAHMMRMLMETPWGISQQKVKQLMEFVKIHFMPIIYKGAALDMVRGRAISRPHQPDRYSGAEIIASMAVFAEVVAGENKQESDDLKSVIKTWVEEEKYRSILAHTTEFMKLSCLENIMNDKAISSYVLPPIHKNFALMDRVIHRSEKFLFALSLHSDRISNYEKGGQTENPFGWHTADGMSYLYNMDLAHYSDQYWNTINPYRLPGTTVDTQPLMANQGAAQKMKSAWVGGVVLNENNGAQGMWYKGNAYEHDLEAKKSWFMLGDIIVCLGAGIKSNQGRTIETIIENRKIKLEATNKLTICNREDVCKGKERINEYNAHEFHKTQGQFLEEYPSWIHLEGNVEGADIGYYFPEESNGLCIEQVTRDGNWATIYFDGDSQIHTREYLEMWVDHGINPKESTYAYAILPGITVQQMDQYAKSRAFEVIKNTSSIQAVKLLEEGILAANIWQAEGAVLEDIKVNAPSAIILKNQNGLLELAIADPTMQGIDQLKIEINACGGEVISRDERITIIQKAPKLQLSVNISQAIGETIKINMRLR